jgi:hypothetical protein
MNEQLFEKQKKIYALFSVMKLIDLLEYSSSGNDGASEECYDCGGVKKHRYDKSRVGHRDGCALVENKRRIFGLIVQECSDMLDGNFFLNLTTEMYLKNVI